MKQLYKYIQKNILYNLQGGGEEPELKIIQLLKYDEYDIVFHKLLEQLLQEYMIMAKYENIQYITKDSETEYFKDMFSINDIYELLNNATKEQMFEPILTLQHILWLKKFYINKTVESYNYMLNIKLCESYNKTNMQSLFDSRNFSIRKILQYLLYPDSTKYEYFVYLKFPNTDYIVGHIFLLQEFIGYNEYYNIECISIQQCLLFYINTICNQHKYQVSKLIFDYILSLDIIKQCFVVYAYAYLAMSQILVKHYNFHVINNSNEPYILTVYSVKTIDRLCRIIRSNNKLLIIKMIDDYYIYDMIKNSDKLHIKECINDIMKNINSHYLIELTDDYKFYWINHTLKKNILGTTN